MKLINGGITMKKNIIYKNAIFKDNKFSEAGLNEYLKKITKDNNIREDMISILTDENCNEYNLNLIKLSEKKSEAKQNYDGLNGFLISMMLFIGGFVIDLFLKDSSLTTKFIFLILAEISLLIIGFNNLRNIYRKPEEKRAEAYFWLESEMERRIKNQQ